MRTHMTTHTGDMGTAEPLQIPRDRADTAATTCGWLLTIPSAHPLWDQYVLWVIELATHVEGLPDAVLSHPGMTHEVVSISVNPEAGGPFTAATLLDRIIAGKAGGIYLMPVNVAHQFKATDAEMVELAEMLAKACVDGYLTPEASSTSGYVAEKWLTACVQTLAHMRGEAHGTV